MRTGRPDEAVAELRSILTEQPNAQSVAAALVRLLVSQKKLADAEALAVQYSRRFPTSPQWPISLAEVLAAGDHPPIDRIIAQYQAAAKASDFAPDVLTRTLAAMLRYKRSDALIAYYDTVCRPTSGNSSTNSCGAGRCRLRQARRRRCECSVKR